MTHSSVVPMTFHSQKMYIYCARGGVVGVSAEDGGILWQTDQWKISIATIPTPVIVSEDKIFLSGGYNAGSMMIQLYEEENQIKAKTLFQLDAKTFGSPQHTPILYNSFIYGVRPDGQLTCLDLEGNIQWTSGTDHRFGLGPYLIADGKIFVLADEGLLTAAVAVSDQFQLLVQAQVLDGHDAWAPMAIASGRLMLRDLTRMVCLDLTVK
jgi:outer membrane protein assembly factor BamB